MADDFLEQLKAIDVAILTEVVRKDQHNPGLTILDWTVEPINHEKVILFLNKSRSRIETYLVRRTPTLMSTSRTLLSM